MDVKNPFRSDSPRRAFDTVVGMYVDRHGDLFAKDGKENRRNNLGATFWKGYRGELCLVRKNTPLWVAYKAGEAVGRAEREEREVTGGC